MSEQKYYQPKIEELHVGFEYEIFEDFDYFPEKSWHKQVYGVNGRNPKELDYVSDLEKVRVKYLDKSDIENIGFKEDVRNSTPDRLNLELYNGTYTIGIVLYNVTKVVVYGYLNREAVLFDGDIKNISELKRLLNQLGVL